jgi:hypothetical protein
VQRRRVEQALLLVQAVVERAVQHGVAPTDVKRNPRCAWVRPPEVAWSVEPASLEEL